MGKNVYDIFKTDEKLESEKGIVLDFGEFQIRILRASKKNKKYMLAMKKFHNKFERQMQKKILSDDKAHDILTQVYAESIVIDWKGVKDDKGKDMPYSQEACLKLFNDLPEMFKMIVEEAESITNFQKEAEKAKKN